ncbi:FadR family transcriptional regulator [Christensenellaceae bacterium NSJ-53]|uniref:FadR family transcriptional regulator n=1 Tax=Gehongia tenuis TaxID=2763655 RepID=A0A926D3V9_9FIRM|nr:GntR family transcriptional regulator [Gehongia tenuis]MBC8531910.1 FadR family transcriptional regulator [Gehongia tenuis]
MDEKRTRSSSIHENLREQIISGLREYGSRLPSAPQLCKSYGVGMRAVRTALKALKEEGLIETGERRRAVVVYRDSLMEQSADVQSILQRKSSVLAVYQTMELIMPDILTFCAQFSGIIELEHYDSTMKWTMYHRDSLRRWRVPSAFFHDILVSSGNPLLASLYTTLEMYGEAPFLTACQRSMQLNQYKFERQSVSYILDALKAGKPQDVRDSLTSHYRYTTPVWCRKH